MPGLNEVPWSDIEKVGSEILSELESTKRPTLMVDLSELDYMGSAMVALIVRLWKSSSERSGEMVVVNSSPRVFEVLKIAGLTKVWTIVDSRADAERQLGKGGGGSGGAGGGKSVLLVTLTFLAAATAGAGLYFVLKPNPAVTSALAQGLAFGGAGLSLIFGIASAVSGRALCRVCGVLFLLAGVAAGGFAAFKTYVQKPAAEKKAGYDQTLEQPIVTAQSNAGAKAL
jgi:anti-anti-sigma factor